MHLSQAQLLKVTWGTEQQKDCLIISKYYGAKDLNNLS